MIFSHIRRLGPFLGVQNLEFRYFCGGEGVQKNICTYFLLLFFLFIYLFFFGGGYEGFVDILGGFHGLFFPNGFLHLDSVISNNIIYKILISIFF